MNSFAKINLVKRDQTPSSLRKSGLIPVVVYGKDCNANASMSEKDSKLIIHRDVYASVYSIEVEGKEYLSLIREIQRDPITGKVLHVDFFQVNLDDEVEVNVNIIPENTVKCDALKQGGVLLTQKNVKAIAKIKDMRSNFHVDVSNLKKGYSLFSDEIETYGLKFKKRLALVSIVSDED